MGGRPRGRAVVRGQDDSRAGRWRPRLELLEERCLLSIQPLPVPLARPAPEGSLVREAAVGGTLAASDPVQDYTVKLAAETRISARVEPESPSLDLVLSVLDGDGSPLAQANARGPGGIEAVVNTPVLRDGVYTLRVASLESLGPFALRVLVNAQLELEELGLGRNDSPQVAENIDDSAVTVADGSDRLYVAGRRDDVTRDYLNADFESEGHGFRIDNQLGLGGGQWHLSRRRGNQPGHSPSWSFYFGNANGSGYAANAEGVLTSPVVDLRGAVERVELSFNYFLQSESFFDRATVEIIADGQVTPVADNAIIGNLANPSGGFRSLSIDISAFAGKRVQVRFHFVSDPFVQGEGWYVDDVVVREILTPPDDYFQFSLPSGRSATIHLTPHGNQPVFLELLNSQGQLLAKGEPLQGEPSVAVREFVPAQSGVYLARVHGPAGPYGLLVTRGGDVERERNQGRLGLAHLVQRDGPILGSVGRYPAAIPREQEPNDDGQPGITLADLRFANDLSGSFVLQEAGRYRASVEGEITAAHSPEIDVFRILASPGDEVAATLQAISLDDPFLRLLDQDGNLLASNDDSGGSLNSRIEYRDFPYAGEYYLVAETVGFLGGRYRLVADIRTSRPQLPSDVDEFAATLTVGDVLVVTASRPAVSRLDAEPLDSLQPRLRLLGPRGNTLQEGFQSADGSQSVVAYQAVEGGVYTLILHADRGTAGEYVLSWSGLRAVPPAPSVVRAIPLAGSYLPKPPGEIELTFSEGVLAPSFSPSDLLVNGQPIANAVQMINARTVRFVLPVLPDGDYAFELPAAAGIDLQGVPTSGYVGHFTVDTVAPRVNRVSFQRGEVLPAGPLVVEIGFTERLETVTLTAADVVLAGDRVGVVRAENFFFDVETNTARITYGNLRDDQYVLTLISGPGFFEDLAGNALDGEAMEFPIPPHLSGNSVAGGDFVVQFLVDTDLGPVPGPQVHVIPAGSLIARAEFAGLIHEAADRDTYRMTLAAGQYISLFLEPHGGLLPQLQVIGPGNVPLAVGTSATQGALLARNVHAAIAGEYQVVVGGVQGTTGGYDVTIWTDADLELEELLGLPNDVMAQDLDGPARTLAAGVDRLAVLGSQLPRSVVIFEEDFEQTAHQMQIDNSFGLGKGQWHRTTGRRNTPGHSPNRAMYFGAGETPDGQGSYRSNAEGMLATPAIELPASSGRITLSFNYFLDIESFDVADVRVLSEDGTFDTVATSLDGTLNPYTFSFEHGTVDLTRYAGKRIRVGFHFVSDGSVEYEGWYVDDIDIRSMEPPSEDWYRVSLAAGQPTTVLAAEAGRSDLRLEVFDSHGELVAAGSGGLNHRQAISRFVPPESGDYLVRIAQGNGDYTLLVLRGADFDRERNEAIPFAQELAPAGAVLGFVREHVESAGLSAGERSGVSRAEDAAAREALARRKLGLPPRGKEASAAMAASFQGARFAEGRVLVRFIPGLGPKDILDRVASAGFQVVDRIDLIQAWVLASPAGVPDTAAAALRWSLRSDVVYAEPDYVYRAAATLPNDPFFDRLYALHNTGQDGGTPGADIGAPAAWDLFRGSANVVIASMDTGVDYNHPDLAANIWTNPGEIPGDGLDNDGNGYIDDVHGWDSANDDGDPWDDNGHGTHTAGTMAAVGNNALGVVGVNWAARIMPLKFLDAFGFGFLSDAVQALDYMVRMRRDFGVNIVASNNSWGGGGYSWALSDAIQASIDAGILFVAAAGNASTNNDLLPSYPASYPLDGILSVAASDRRDLMADFSNYGPVSVDLAAPGVNVFSTLPGGRYGEFSGTSMAAPHVTGTAALLAGLRPDLSVSDLHSAILEGVDKVNSLESRVASGGRLSAVGTLVPWANPDDWYRVASTLGLPLTVSTGVPTVGLGEPSGNAAATPELLIELYSVEGTLLAVSAPLGPGEVAATTVATGGPILVRVASSRGEGSYVLRVAGDDRAPPPLTVVQSDLADGSALAYAPSRMTVRFNSELFFPTLTAGDLTVDGIAAASLRIVDGKTVEFALPALGEGAHHAQFPAGVVRSVAGGELAPFSVGFEVDLTPPRITHTTILPGVPAAAGETAIEITFSEPLRTENLDANDLQLLGRHAGLRAPSSLAFDPTGTMLRMMFGNLPDDQYTLRLISGDKRFEDRVGNDLDGELVAPGLPTGDGLAGGHFEMTFLVDREEQPLPSFDRVEPLGSLVYESRGTSYLAGPNDVDAWNFNARTGQFLSVVVEAEPGRRVRARLISPEGKPLAMGETMGTSPVIILPTVIAAASGLFRVEVEAEDPGVTSARVVLNAALEREALAGASNDSLETAESLAGLDLTIAGAASRIAILGSQVPSSQLLFFEDFEAGMGSFAFDEEGVGGGQWHWSMGRGFDLGHSASYSLYFGTGESIDGGGLYAAEAAGAVLSPMIDLRGITGDIRLELNYFLEIEDFFDRASIDVLDQGGVFPLADNTTLGNLADQTGQFRAASFDLSRFGGREIRLRFTVTTDYTVQLEGWYIDDIAVRLYARSNPDLYGLELEADEAVQVSVESADARNLRLELLGPDGVVLRVAAAGSLNVSQEIREFRAPAAGTYYLRLSGTRERYTLLVTRRAVFDAERNNDFATAQSLGDDLIAFGYLIGAERATTVSTAAVPTAEAAPRRNVGAAAPGRIIVQFDNPLLAAAHAKSLRGEGGRAEHLSIIAGLSVDVDTRGESLEQALSRWQDLPGVSRAEADSVLRAAAIFPNDPRFHEQYALQNTGQTGGRPGADINAPAAWEYTTGRGQVVIAVIDTGIDYRHEDLAQNMWINPGEIPGDGIDNDNNGYVDDIHGIDVVNNDSDPRDDEGHGTHVAGILGAVADNGRGITGVNWNAQIMALKFLDRTGVGTASGAIRAMEYMTMMKTRYGVNIVVSNNSWSGSEFSQALLDAIRAAIDAGILFVAAAGNEGRNADAQPVYPAGYNLPGIISVAATDHNDRLATFSNFGEVSVDIAAPGVNILSTTPGNTYSVFSGTSMAVPYVAGTAALLAEANPSLTVGELRQAILDGAAKLPVLAGKVATGGRLNALQAAAFAVNPDDWYRFDIPEGTVFRVLATRLTQALPGGPDIQLELYGSQGTILRQGADIPGDPSGSQLWHRADVGGTYTARVTASVGRGEYVLRVERLAAPPPQIVGVYVSSTQWGAPFFDALAEAGSGDPRRGYALWPANSELVLPWTALDTISIRFSQDVHVAATDLVLRSAGRPIPLAAGGFRYDPDSLTATWTMRDSFRPGALLAQVRDVITSVAGIPLDGERFARGMVLASGDGVPGGDFFVRAHVLAADVNGSGSVDLADFSWLKLAFGYVDVYADLNGNGSVDLADFSVLKVQFGRSVSLPTTISPRRSPLPPPAAGAPATFARHVVPRAWESRDPLAAELIDRALSTLGALEIDWL